MEVVQAPRNLQLLKIRNPQGGHIDFQGEFSHGSHRWTRELRAMCRYDPDSTEDDGTFWMTFSEFVSVFNRVYVCMLLPPERCFGPLSLVGRWQGRSAGGCSNFGTWRHNPLYALSVRQSSRVYVTLTQPDQRAAEQKNVYPPIGVSIVRMRKGHFAPPLVSGAYDVVAKTPYWPKRDVACEVCSVMLLLLSWWWR